MLIFNLVCSPALICYCCCYDCFQVVSALKKYIIKLIQEWSMPKLYLHFYFHFEVPEVNHFIWPLKVIAWLLLAMYLVSQNISQQRKQCDDGTFPNRDGSCTNVLLHRLPNWSLTHYYWKQCCISGLLHDVFSRFNIENPFLYQKYYPMKQKEQALSLG